MATVTRPRRRLRWSSHGSGDCPTTTWYRVSFGILKHPPAARTDACEVSDANSSCSLAAAAGSARGSTVTVTTSAEAVSSAIRRLSHHHMMSGNVCTGLELVCRPYNRRRIMETLFRAPRQGSCRCEYSCSQLVVELFERMLSSRLTTSTPGVVTAIENRTQNVHKQP